MHILKCINQNYSGQLHIDQDMFCDYLNPTYENVSATI